MGDLYIIKRPVFCSGELPGLQQPESAPVRLVQHPLQRAVLGQPLHDARLHLHLLPGAHDDRQPALHQVS